MNRLLNWITLILLFTAACNRKHDPAVTPSSDASPQIVGVRISGVPSDSITIDQATKKIAVHLPAGWNQAQVQPWFTASNGVKWAPLTYSLQCLCGCSSEARVQVGSKLSIYQIQFIAAEKPSIKSVTGPTEYVIGESYEPLVVSVDHVYAPSDSIQLRFRNVADARTFIFSCATNNMQYNWRENTVDLKIYLSAGLPSGKYAIEIPWSNGGASVAKQTLTIKKGKAKLSTFIPFVNALTSGQPTTLMGENLFEGDIEVVLKSVDGKEYRLKPSQNAIDGNSMTLTPSPDMAPGYYQLRLFQNGEEQAACYRAAVTRYANQPTVGKLDLYTKNSACALTEDPLVYQRGELGNFMGSPLVDSMNPSVKLTSLSDLRRSVVLPVNTNVIETFPKFTIPANLTPGRYQLTFQVVTKDKQTLESEPYERVIDIQ